MTALFRWLQHRGELGIAVLLFVVGAVVLGDASRIASDAPQRGAIGPTAVPVLVGTLLLVCAVLLGREVRRGRHGNTESSEGIDPSHRSDWRTVLLVSAAFLTNAVLIDWAGWVVSGTVLFWGSAYALGSRTYLRDLLIAVVLAVASFYLFAQALGIGLPAGILTGVL